MLEVLSQLEKCDESTCTVSSLGFHTGKKSVRRETTEKHPRLPAGPHQISEALVVQVKATSLGKKTRVFLCIL